MGNSWYKRIRKQNEFVQENIMPHPIVCQDERLRQYLHSFQALFSRPQYEHFVTVLMSLLLSLESYTLSHSTLGQARKEVQKAHQKLFLEWIYQQAFSGTPIQELFCIFSRLNA